MNLKSLDKSNWPSFRFDEIAQNISERVDPNNTELKTYIGLTHIDSEALRIKRFGTPDDVNGTKLKFYKGDIIFGRRRAYQRKAGIATMDGFCSAHALVLRANPEVIDPQLFPFFLHSDLFMNRAIDISVGSLSPTINWGNLKHQTFKVPPLTLQKDFADILVKLERLIQERESLVDSLERYKYIKTVEHFNNGSETTRPTDIDLRQGFELRPLKDVIPDIEYGISISIPKNQNRDGIPIISTAEITKEGNLIYSDIRSITYDKLLQDRLILRTNDLLFNWRNSIELIGKTTIFDQSRAGQKDVTFASFLLRMRCDEVNAHNRYFMHLLNYYREVGVFVGLARKAVNQANFNKNEVYELLVPVPAIERQKKISTNIDQIIDRIIVSRSNVNSSIELRRSLTQKMFA